MAYIGNTLQNQNYVPAIDYFNGDGSTVAFTLSRPVASVAAVQAVISNVPQNPGSAFTVSGSTITFTSAPPSGTANIYVYYTSPNTQVVQPGQGTVGPTQVATDYALWNKSGSAINYTAGNVGIGTSSPSQKLQVVGSQLLANPGSDVYTYFDGTGTSIGRKASTGELVLTVAAGSPTTFINSTTEYMRINAGAPILCLSGGNTSATGTGIAFPATQSASSDANTLDDYEEGTWTPAFSFGTSGSVTYNTQAARYTKVGNMVTATFWLQIGTVSSPSGTVTLTGLPFTVESGSQRPSPTLRGQNLTGATGVVGGIVVSGGTTVALALYNNGLAPSLQGNNFQIGSEVGGTICYLSA